jgi:hypothetical protein
MNYDCPQCHSSQTASFEMMHAQGTQSGNISGSTVTFGGDIGLTSGQFNSQTVLAGRLSPPGAPKAGCGIQILICIASLIISVLVSGTILTVVDAIIGISRDTKLMEVLLFGLTTVFLLYGLYRYNRFIQEKKMPVYREQLQEWSDSMICRRCGYMWIK